MATSSSSSLPPPSSSSPAPTRSRHPSYRKQKRRLVPELVKKRIDTMDGYETPAINPVIPICKNGFTATIETLLLWLNSIVFTIELTEPMFNRSLGLLNTRYSHPLCRDYGYDVRTFLHYFSRNVQTICPCCSKPIQIIGVIRKLSKLVPKDSGWNWRTFSEKFPSIVMRILPASSKVFCIKPDCFYASNPFIREYGNVFEEEGPGKKKCAHCPWFHKDIHGHKLCCPGCMTSWCEICNISPYHKKSPCLGKTDLDPETAKLIPRRCPGCGEGIEKTMACDHMTCPCGTHWCYRCGGKLNPLDPTTGHVCASRSEVSGTVDRVYGPLL